MTEDFWVDPALAPFGVFVDLMSVASTALLEGSEHVPSLWVERLVVELPFEMDVGVGDNGRVRLAGGPPTQYTETTFLPVFHKMGFTVIGEANGGGDGS